MGQQQSKDELLYQQVNYGSSEGIITLHREGAGLEWIDKEMKTPLILACMNPSLFDVTKTLIELGANSRKVWVVVLPCGSRNLRKPFKLELAVYTNLQDAQPRTIIALWKANMEEPNFSQPDPTVIITDSTSRTRIKLAAASESDKQQLQWFCNACKGISQVVQPAFPFTTAPHVVTATAPPTAEDVELATAINASLQSAMQERPPHLGIHPVSQSDPSTSRIDSESSSSEPASPNQGSSSSGYRGPETAPVEVVAQQSQTQSGPSITESMKENSAPASIPSAPPLEDSVIEDGPIHYPSIDDSPLDFAPPPVETKDAGHAGKDESGTSSSSCVICLDAPIEGTCIPCGHMAGCMSCLNEIKAKKWGCPVCRAKIDQVVRLYAV